MTEQAKVPAIRFAGFTDPWEQRKFVDFVEASGIRNKDNLQLESYSVSNDRGFVPQDEQFENGGTMRDADKTAYWIVEPGSFAYNPARINVGSIGYQSTRKNVIVSSLYEVFKTDHSCDDRFLWHWFKSSLFTKQIEMLQEGGVRLYFFFDKLQKSEIWMPNVDEQRIIGQQFDQLDSLITLHQRKYDKLVIFKKSMLEKMFPKDGESVPEIRFAGFTDPWEQRKLGELVVIERGGSPRPIDEYITDDTNGLNWVKIGDAPSLGRYISKTSEKIKPEGLSKTRQVHPGDLILSNSMSFGRPYIMAIEGCIHDGWLLIRDEPKSFDPMYLCHMLGTPKMLNQYRMLASGSTVNNLNKELVSNASILMPCKSEQKVIGQFFNHLDDLITLHQRKRQWLKWLDEGGEGTHHDIDILVFKFADDMKISVLCGVHACMTKSLGHTGNRYAGKQQQRGMGVP